MLLFLQLQARIATLRMSIKAMGGESRKKVEGMFHMFSVDRLACFFAWHPNNDVLSETGLITSSVITACNKPVVSHVHVCVGIQSGLFCDTHTCTQGMCVMCS